MISYVHSRMWMLNSSIETTSLTKSAPTVDQEEVDRRDADEKRKDREEKITYILLAFTLLTIIAVVKYTHASATPASPPWWQDT